MFGTASVVMKLATTCILERLNCRLHTIRVQDWTGIPTMGYIPRSLSGNPVSVPNVLSEIIDQYTQEQALQPIILSDPLRYSSTLCLSMLFSMVHHVAVSETMTLCQMGRWSASFLAPS